MDYYSIIRENGPALGILAIFTFSVTYFVGIPRWDIAQNQTVIASLVAFAVVGIVLLFSTNFNDQLMRLFAERRIAEAYVQIKLNQGAEKEFYTDYDKETREAIDDLDERGHQAIVSILSALLIALTILGIGILEYGIVGLIAGLIAALVVLAMIGYPAYTTLHDAIDFAVRESKSNHEN